MAGTLAKPPCGWVPHAVKKEKIPTTVHPKCIRFVVIQAPCSPFDVAARGRTSRSTVRPLPYRAPLDPLLPGAAVTGYTAAMTKRVAPAAERNKEAILEILREVL